MKTAMIPLFVLCAASFACGGSTQNSGTEAGVDSSVHHPDGGSDAGRTHVDGGAHRDTGGARDTGSAGDSGMDGKVGPTDAAPDAVPPDPNNCVPPGTPNNAEGVGGYCSPGGGQCAHAGPGGQPTICTADFGSMVPAHAWFCTNVCSLDAGVATCGDPGPPCSPTPDQLSVCLPTTCTNFLGGDGGFSADGGAGDSTETIMVGGMSRTFIVHKPPSYTGATPVPLVLDFHPLDVTAAIWKGATPWAAMADTQGFIVVWPQGYMNSWNVGRPAVPAEVAGVDDVAFTRAMIAQLSVEDSIDPKRIYATGCSNGGGMSYMLACNAADVIAAVAPVDFDCTTGATNNPSCGSCAPSRAITECQFRGTADIDCPYDGGATPVLAGLLFPGAPANFATWAGIDSCTGSPAAESAHPSCETYGTCAADAGVTLCTVASGMHCESYGTFPIVDIAWGVFQAHPLP